MASKLNQDPNANTATTSNLGASRGRTAVAAQKFVADTSGSVSGQGTAQALGNAAQLGLSLFDQKDKMFQRNQRMEFQGEIDNINNEFGVRDATNLEEQAGRATPQQIQQSSTELGKLEKARQAGKLGQTAYWGRVNSVVRQLRAKYPAYRDQIDSMVSGITGTTPANALRRSLLADQSRKQTAASNPEAILRKFKEKNIQFLPVAHHGLNYQQTFDYVAARKRELAALDLEKSQAGLTSTRLGNQNKLTANQQKEGGIILTKELASETSHGFSAISANISSLIAQAREKAKNSGSLPVGDQNQLRITYSTLAEQWTQRSNAIISKYGRMGLDQGALDKAKASMEGQINGIKEQLFNNQWGLLQHTTATVNAMKTGDQFSVLGFSEDARKLTALRGLYGDNIANTMVMGDLGKYTAFGNIMMDMSLGRGKPLRTIMSTSQTKDAPAAKIVNGIADQAKKILLDSKSTVEQITTVANSLYGEGNIGFLSDIATKDQSALFQRMTTEDVASKMWKMRDSNPDVWNNYRRWTVDSFKGLMRTQVRTAQEAIVNRKFVDVGFNEKTGQFWMDERKEGNVENKLRKGNPVRQISYLLEKGWLEPATVTALTELNKGLLGLTPVLNKEGDDPINMIKQIVQGLGINFDAQKKGPEIETFFASLQDSVSKFLVGTPQALRTEPLQ